MLYLKRSSWTTALLGTAAVLSFVAWMGIQSTQSPASADAVTGPAEIVAFSSVLTRSEPGRPLQMGRFFRGPDGSERHEVGPSLDVVQLVEIKNIPYETYYLWDERNPGVWVAHPMILDEHVRSFPRTMSRKMLTPNPTGQVMKHEGFDVVLLARDGLTRRIAPALNFLDVDRVMPNGTRTMHTNIRVGDVVQFAAALPALKTGPARDPLFEPPDAATIQWSTTPSGIISGTRGGVRKPGGH